MKIAGFAWAASDACPLCPLWLLRRGLENIVGWSEKRRAGQGGAYGAMGGGGQTWGKEIRGSIFKPATRFSRSSMSGWEGRGSGKESCPSSPPEKFPMTSRC